MAVRQLPIGTKTIKGEEDTLKQMVDRNAGIERDVERYKERKKIEHAVISLLL